VPHAIEEEKLMSNPKEGSDEHQLREALSKWTPEKPGEYLERARWSLETVTHLTEYEDEKANRILTAMTFLSALVGVVYLLLWLKSALRLKFLDL
jgi:hypothetical protein